MTQNGEELAKVNGEWPLESFSGSLSVAVKDGTSIVVPLVDDSPLVFKLERRWSEIGRNVRRMTRGRFLLVAPCSWTRTGHTGVAQEACSDSGFRAHFLVRNGNESAEELGGFEGHELALSGSGFELTGRRIFDDSEEGDLFGNEPPVLNPAQGVAWARIGEECRNGWTGENFKPAEKTLANVLGSRQGRFFVRVYDREGHLLDSGQFRYLSALQEIEVNGAPYSRRTLLLPPPDGHPPTKVRFTGTSAAAICPILPTEAEQVEGARGSLVARPTPGADDISCVLEADGGKIDIALKLPRIWWRIQTNTADADGRWRDTPFVMSRQKFRKWAAAEAVLQLRLPRRIQSVQAGFDDEAGPRYPNRKSSSDHFEMPVAHFVDYRQIDLRLPREARFNVRFEGPGHWHDRGHQEPLCLIRVSPDPLPEIVSFRCEPANLEPGDQARLCWTTRNTDGVAVAVEPSIGQVEPAGDVRIAPAETTTYTLKLAAPDMAAVTSQATIRIRSQRVAVEKPVARVRRSDGGWRTGRGFSQRELRAAGLTLVTAGQRSIPADPRRRSSHLANVQALMRPEDG